VFFDGWSELAPTNAPVEDEPVQPVLRMNILPARCVFFFSPLLCPTPTLNLPPLPTYHLRTPPPLTPSPDVELWSRSCGVGAGARAPTRPTPPRSGKMLIFLFIFVCFVWRGKQAPSSGASPELLGFGACLLLACLFATCLLACCL
jgi:hypothetical protein